MATKKQATNETPLELSEKILHDLEAKRARVAAKRVEDDREVESISYHVHTGDKDASERFEAIRSRAMKREMELKSLDAAIVTAKAKVQEAKAREQVEVERLAASELIGLCKVLREAGRQCDDALTVLGEASTSLADTINAINRLGVTHPSSLQLASLGERACRTALRQMPWARAFSDIAPADRRDFSFTSEWACTLEQTIERKLEHLNKGGGSTRAA